MNFISSAFAQVPGITGSSTDIINAARAFGIILVIMYPDLRPQQRRAKSIRISSRTSGARHNHPPPAV